VFEFSYTPRRMNLMLYSGTSCAFALAKKRSGQLALLAVAKFGNPAKFVLPLFFAVLIYVKINSGRKKQGRLATNSLGANLNCRRQAPWREAGIAQRKIHFARDIVPLMVLP